MNKNVLMSIGALVVAGLIIFFALRNAPNDANGDENGIVCTMDAKLCPDGSYVGRVPPSCEFAACPNATSTDLIDPNDPPSKG